jgi:hypothetical protein
LRPAQTLTISEIHVEVTTAVASSNAVIAIYGANADGSPGALIDSSANLDTGSTGQKTWVLDEPFEFVAGTAYYIVLHSSAAITVRALPAAQAAVIAVIEADGANSVCTTIRATETFGTLPNPANTGSPVAALVPLFKFVV